MELKIYNQGGTLKATVSPADSSTHSHELMGENVVSVTFTYPEYMTLDVNDYIEFEGVKYTLRSACEPVQKSTLEYTYNVKFYGREGETTRVRMLHSTDGEYETKFSLDGSSREHLQKVADNLNRIRESDPVYSADKWEVESFVTGPNQNIEYSNVSCAEALSKIAEAFDAEWWLEGTRLNLGRCEVGATVDLGYMQGLTELTRADNENVPFFTRLIPLGSTRNIDREKYGFTRLQLPGGVKYVEQNMQYGLYETVEETAFADIYPHRVGTVTAAPPPVTKKGENGEFKVYYFKDDTLDFNPEEYMLGGLKFRVVFQSGELNGRDFEVDYNSKTKLFEIINEYPDEKTQLPDGRLIPGVGDSYILYNMRMPESYITAAEKEFQKAVEDYLAKYSVDNAIYRGNTDYIYIEKNQIALRVGLPVNLISDKYFKETGFRKSRITKVSRNLNCPSKATIECTNAVGKGRIASIEGAVSDIKTIIADRLEMAVLTVLRSWESGEATDANVFSALRTIKEIQRRALRRDIPDETEYLIKLLAGLMTDNIESQEFTEGALGSGFTLRRDPATGQSYAEVDKLMVRMKAEFRELVIEKLSHVGGEIVLTPASIKCTEVVDDGSVYRCYFDNDDGERAIGSGFVEDDLARCQTFNIKEGAHEGVNNHFYWRLVKAVNEEDGYIELSKMKDEYEEGSGIPQAGDEIVQLGNRTNKERQNAIVLSSYASDAPSIKQYAGINTFELREDMEVTRLSPKGNVVKGKLFIDAGTEGWRDLDDLPGEIQKAVDLAADAMDGLSTLEYGKNNLLRNSGLTGDYLSAQLSGEYSLYERAEMFSPSLIYWDVLRAVARDSEVSESGKEVELTNGSMSQALFYKTLPRESYIFSFRGKGRSLTFTCGGYTTTVGLTNEWKRYVCRFESPVAGSTFSILDATAVICELQLERGNVPSAWGASMMDNTSELAKYQSMQYMAAAIKEGKTSVLGGLILASQLQLGEPKDGDVKQVTAGVSGLYSHAEDVAFWAGGDYVKALTTMQAYRNNPAYTPTEGELTEMANFVVTHGGQAYLNDVILRGYVYALGGIFKGKVDVGNGKILLREDGSGQLAGGKIKWEVNGDAVFEGEVSAAKGQIGGFNIYDGYLENKIKGEPDEMYLSRHLIKFNNNYTDLYMGADTYPSTGGGALVTPIRVEVNRLVEKYDYGGNVGLYLSITGAKAYDDMVYSGNSALYIPNGNIQGFRLRQRRVTSSEELSKMDSIILSKASSDITLTFPSGCEDGQMFIIKKQGMGNVTVSASGGDMIANKIDEIVLTVTIIRGWCYTFYYDAFKKQWWHTRAADAWST